MGDSTVKSDSGNDLVLSNNGGSGKIEINNDNTIAVTGTVSGITATEVGLGNVTNESKATMFTSPTFTGNVALGSNATGTFNGTIGTSASGFGLITDADQWRLSADVTGAVGDITTANMEQNDDAGFGHIGSDMTYSSGVFTFPKTGIWWIEAHFVLTGPDAVYRNYGGGYIKFTTNNLDYTTAGYAYTNFHNGSGVKWGSCVTTFFFDVTSTLTHKVMFLRDVANTDVITKGNTYDNATHFNFIRLGDT